MKKIYQSALILILIIVGSCSKKSDPVVVVIPPCAVTKITQTYSAPGLIDQVTTYTFVYDSDLRLTQATQVYTGANNYSITYVYSYLYTNGMLTGIKDGSGNLFTWTNDSGHVVKISGTTAGSYPVTSTTNLTYDSQGKLLTNNYVNDLGVGNAVNYAFTFTSDGNVQTSSRQTFNGGTSQGQFVLNYTAYDGKNNPFLLLAKAINQPYFYYDVYGSPNDYFFNKNNALAAVYSSGSDDKITYTYQYNDASYPTKAVKTETLSSTSSITTTTLFEYKTCK